MQLVSVIALAIWGLWMYGTFQRENNRLVNEKLNADLLIAGYDVEAKSQTRYGRSPVCKISKVRGDAPHRQFLVEYSLTLKNNSEKHFVISRNAFQMFQGRLGSAAGAAPIHRQPAVGEPPAHAPKGALVWTKRYEEANEFQLNRDAATQAASREVMGIPFVGRDGTGRLTGGQSITWSFSFVVNESDADWIGFSTYYELDEGIKPEDKTWRMDRYPLREGTEID